MPTTSNFGWTTPADTDLVKDGAAAIRTLGNGIDTSLLDLKGGTSGQVLSKNSNTDLDYTWVTPNVGDITEVQAGVGISVASGTGPIPIITNSSTDLITTAGDLLYGTAADTVARLGIGTAGQLLAVNSGATAPEWIAAPAAGGSNWSLLNSGGTALTGATTVTVTGISGKDKIMVLVAGASSATAEVEINVRLNTDTGSNYYNYGGLYLNQTTYGVSNLLQTNGAQTSILVAQMGASAASTVSGTVLLSGCNSAGVKAFQSLGGASSSSAGHRGSFLGGYYNSATVISSVSVVSLSGNLDAGTVFVYTSTL